MYDIPRYRLMLVRDHAGAKTEKAPRVRNSEDLYGLLASYFDPLDREHFVLVALDAKHAIIGMHTISVGSLTLSIVHPREVWKAALLMNPGAIILAHNHPSGDPTPSQEDRALTARLVGCGDLLGIRVLDHIIFGEGRYCSMADRGQMPTPTEYANSVAA